MNRQELLRAYGLIPVGKHTVAIVDAVDAKDALRFEWRLKKSKFRPVAFHRNVNGKVYYMHHAVCTEAHGPRPSPEHVCEALNGDTLDCRRENLQWVLKADTGYRRAKRLGDEAALALYARRAEERASQWPEITQAHTNVTLASPPTYEDPPALNVECWPERTH